MRFFLLKLDGYQALQSNRAAQCASGPENDKDFNARFPDVAKAFAALPDETVVDGEAVALD